MGFFSDSETEEEDPVEPTIPVLDAAALDEAGVAAAEGGEVLEEQEGEEVVAEEEEEEESCKNCGGQSSVRVVDGELKCMACARREQPQDEVDDVDNEGPPHRRGSNVKRLDDGFGYTRGEFIEYYGEQVPSRPSQPKPPHTSSPHSPPQPHNPSPTHTLRLFLSLRSTAGSRTAPLTGTQPSQLSPRMISGTRRRGYT